MARGDGGTKRRTDAKFAGSKKPWRAWIDLGPGLDTQGRRQRRIVAERYFEKERQAKDWLAAKRSELNNGRPPVDRRNRRLTVGAILDAYVEHGKTLGDWSPSHARRTRQLVEGDLAALHHIPADEFTVADVEAVIARRQQEGVAPNTIRLMRNALSASLNLAIRREQLPPWANVAARAQAPKVREEDPRFIPPHLIAAFLNGLQGERYRVPIMTALTLALRPSEAVGLRWSEIDLDIGEVTIRRSLQYVGHEYIERERPKDDENRVIALPGFLVRALREHRERQFDERQVDLMLVDVDRPRTPAQERRAESSRRQHEARRERRAAKEARWPGLVFTTRAGGPIHEPAVTRRLRAIIERINRERLEAARAGGPAAIPEALPTVTMYQLRHTGATWMLREGVPESHLQAIMGHSSPAMTRRYAHVVEPLRRDAAALLDASLSASGDALVGELVGETHSGGRSEVP